MIVIGVQELEEHIGDVLRRVRAQGETVEVVDQGEVVLRLTPVQRPPIDLEVSRKAWADLRRFAEELSAEWPVEVSALDAVHEVRRDL